MANISPAEHSHGIDLESALDFLNTLHPGHGRTDEQHQRDEHLARPTDAAMWFLEHELVHPDAGIRIGDDDLARIRRVRSALREVVDSVVEGRKPERRRRPPRERDARDRAARRGSSSTGRRCASATATPTPRSTTPSR